MDEEKGNIMQSLQQAPGYPENEQVEGMEYKMQDGDDDLDDLDDLGMFHKSSLKEPQEIPLPERAQEVYGVKKTMDGQNECHIGAYIDQGQIGRGAFAEVLKVEKQGKQYAMKVYSLLKLRSQKFFAADGSFANGEEMLQNQLNIIKRLENPNLVRCDQILHGGTYIYVVGDLCDLGQIMNWDQLKNNYARNEKVTGYIGQKYNANNILDITRIIFLQAALGVQYMHDHNITNRDIKVDNILCMTTPQQGADIKIADYTTVRYSHDDLSFFPSGTPGFRGPEQQFATSEGYSCKATDVWSLGISIYTFFVEQFPFMGESELEIDIKAQNNALQFPEDTPTWFAELLTKMTAKNWRERINIKEVIEQLITHQ